LKLRKPVRPATLITVVKWIVRLFEWVVVPALLLPIIWKPRFRRTIGYWLACPLLLLIAFYVPYKLVNWVPRVKGLPLETFSFSLRFLTAYLLGVTAWLVLVSISSVG